MSHCVPNDDGRSDAYQSGLWPVAGEDTEQDDDRPTTPLPIFPRVSGGWVVIATAAVAVAGLGAVALVRFGIERSADASYVRTPQFALWTLLLGVEGSVWVLAAMLLWRQWRLLRNAAIIRQVDSRMVGWNAVAVGILTLLALTLPMFAAWWVGLASDAPLWGHAFKIYLLTALGLLAAVPAVLCISAIRQIAESADAWPANHFNSSDLEWIGFLSSRLKVVVGFISLEIALLVTATGALNQALRAAKPPIETLSSTSVIAYGALFSGVTVGWFVYGNQAIVSRAKSILDDWAPLPERKPADAIRTRLDTRKVLAAELGLDTSLKDSIGTAVIVALPLLSALLSESVGARLGV